jgi:hypothetical protein
VIRLIFIRKTKDMDRKSETNLIEENIGKSQATRKGSMLLMYFSIYE